MLAGKAYMERHNQGETPPKVLENKQAKILWDFQIQTDKMVVANQPDIVVVDKHQKRVVVIDVAIPSDSNFRKKEHERLEKDQGLKEEIERMWGVKATVVPIVIGTLGAVIPKLSRWLQQIPGTTSVIAVQKSTVLGTAEILGGRRQLAHTVLSVCGELVTSPGAIIRRWKEYFQELLNPTNTYPQGVTESDDLEVDHPIFGAEVAEVVKQLPGGGASEADEIRPGYLKALDVVGLSWLTCICNITWTSGAVPLDWQTGVVVPIFKNGDQRVCSNYRGITLLSLPGKVYARVLEKRIRLIVEPLIKEEQCGFRPGRGTTDQLFTLAGVLEGRWEFAQPVHMCFVDLEKAYDRVPRSILWGVFREYGVEGPLIRAVQSLYQRSRSLVQIAGYDIVLLVPSNRDLHQMLGRFATKCEAAGMRISTSKSESMVLAWKKVECLLRVGEEVLPQVEEFKYLGILFTSEGRMEREIDRRIGAASAVMQALNRSVVMKKELSRKAKLSIYRSIYVPVLTYGHQRWVMTERTRSRLK
ncbi:hypothetical protein D4764_20G0009780 [Takifugu flavidus]|uniref:Reverse transcriptase domain-containing protein n=1 Tax=Takifugu flavidus TaxID=433684 RepID=A0A5C6NIL3_9TELE|nr:hypothetical protein D4764_20G0009780 [Takifugu flavidus]